MKRSMLPVRPGGAGKSRIHLASRVLRFEQLEDRHVLATYVVNMEGTAGNASATAICDVDLQTPGEQCTFNAALYAATFSPGEDLIAFAIDALNLESSSPNLGGDIIIDGLHDRSTKVQFNGDVRLFTDISVRNFEVHGNVRIFQGTDVMVSDNDITGSIFLETDSSGSHILNNRVDGPVGILSYYETSNFVIKGNTIVGGGSIGLKAGAGNFIEDNVILGSVDNDISYASGHGITLQALSTGNVIRGNFIGVTPGTHQVVANELNGLNIGGTGHTIVGNTIGGSNAGIFLAGDHGDGGHQVQKNFIGTDSTGTLDLGNDLGIFIMGNGNTIGGPSAEDGNIIAFNDGGGVAVFFQASGNSIRGNRIYDNGGPGIRVPSDVQDAPVIRQSCDGMAQINVNGEPGKSLVIDFYSNPPDGPTGNEGHEFLGSTTVTTDSVSGMAAFDSPATLPAGHTLSATATDEDGNTSEFSQLEVRTPVFVLPGIAGTGPTNVTHADWIVGRGAAPETMQTDPIGLVYFDLIQTLKNAGYQDGSDLFVVNYDWRVVPAPNDGTADGHISGLTGVDISQDRANGQYRFGVDYLGRALRQVSEYWRTHCPGLPMNSVDVIAHSTGGLVTRAYIQSDAYQDFYDGPNGTKRLPAVRKFIMLDVPNQGASKPWNPLHDEWDAISDSDVSYRFLSNYPEAAFRKMVNGTDISGPDYVIRRGAGPDTPDVRFVNVVVENGEPVRDEFVTSRFIELYIPTLRTLLATYDFVDYGDGILKNVNPTVLGNWLALDLNGNASDVNAFVDQLEELIVFYGDGESTPFKVTKEICGLFSCPDRYSMLDSYTDNDRESGEIYWTESTITEGDGTVPRISLVGQFENDLRVTKSRWDKGDNTNDGTDHAEIVMNRDVQKAILSFLGNDPVNVDLSFNHQRGAGGVRDGWVLMSDPVEAIVTDANGKRLGYSRVTGVLAEIPNSVYVGNSDGMGFVFGPVALPLTLSLGGLDDDYFVEVSGSQDGKSAELELSGTLAMGETQVHQVSVLSDVSWQNPVNPYDVNNDSAVSPLDALLAINELTHRVFSDRVSGQLQPITAPPTVFLDVNGDGLLTPQDALLVINELLLNSQQQPSAASSRWLAERQEASWDALDLVFSRMYLTKNKLPQNMECAILALANVVHA